MVVQRKTLPPVRFELTEPTRTAVAAWIAKAAFRSEISSFEADCDSHVSPSVREDRRLGGSRWPGSFQPTVRWIGWTKATLIQA